MTEFYFVRHGQTLVNVRHAFNGGLIDEPLTASGLAAARAAGAALADIKFNQIVSSSMPRALTTAGCIVQASRYRLPLAPADGLREMKLGVWEGLTADQVTDTEALEAYFHDPVRFDRDYAARVEVEPYQTTLRRSRAVIAATYAANPSGKVLIVGHGLVFQLLLNSLLGVPFAQLRQPKMLRNATISQLDTLDGQSFINRKWDLKPEELK